MPSIYKHAHGANWFLIFHHNLLGKYFASSEYLFANSEHKYSALGMLEKFRINGEFEFLLEYPQTTGYNRFKQTSNPATTNDRVDNYVKKHISWDYHGFAGLALSSSSSTFIDGSPGITSWFYAIGQNSAWCCGNIPGPFYQEEESILIDEVNLWVRMPYLRTFSSCRRSRLYIDIMILVIVS